MDRLDVNNNVASEIKEPAPSWFDTIKISQETWRGYERSKISRPVEVPQNIVNKIDLAIKNTFPKYIPENRPTPIIAWSVLKDEPLSKRELTYERRLPVGINEKDERHFFLGMHQINEFAIDFAASLVEKNLAKGTVLDSIADKYGKFAAVAQKEVYGETYKIMQKIQESSNPGIFKDAICNALFLHNFSAINSLLANLDDENFNSLNQFAISVGRRIDSGKINTTDLVLSKTSLQDGDSEIVKNLKRLTSSYFLGGWQSQPGVVEIFAGRIAAAASLGPLTAFGVNPLTGLLLATGVLAAHVPQYGHLVFHETIHEYSANNDYYGFLPRKVISIKGSQYNVATGRRQGYLAWID